VCNQTSKALHQKKHQIRDKYCSKTDVLLLPGLSSVTFWLCNTNLGTTINKLINHLEITQRRATRYILNLPFSSDIDYKTRLQSLHLLPMCYWHEYLDLVLFFKITHGLLKTSASPVIQNSRRTTRSNSRRSSMSSPDVKQPATRNPPSLGLPEYATH
jgi:hypothetical protein